jgi:putative transposase
MGGFVFHVFNRSARQMILFLDERDYGQFEDAMAYALRKVPMRVLSYSVMPNHFHLILWPRTDNEMTAFMQLITGVHAQWWRLQRGTTGAGAVYQGRYKAVPVQSDDHLLRVCRYVERNALRAGLVDRAEDWRWCSLWRHQQCSPELRLSEWPVPRPPDWVDLVNNPESQAELEALRLLIKRGRPIGTATWQKEVARAFQLDHTLRGRGRPKGDRPKSGKSCN